MLIYIVRHGETRSNVEGYLQGWTDDPLNENGIELARITGRAMRGVTFDICYSSPLQRAWKTAEIILQESGNVEVPVLFENSIKEIHMGEYEGKKFRPGERDTVIDEHQLRLFFAETFHFAGFPGGENIQQVCERTQKFLKSLIARDDGKTYLLTTHGVALRAMLNYLYETPSDFWHGHVPYNCAVNILEAKNGEVKLIAEDKIYYDEENVIDRFAKF